MRSAVIAIPLSLVMLAGACGNTSQPPPPGESPAGPPSAAQVLFDTKCAVCHGITGAGNGPNADQFEPKLHNYTDPVWQASITDEEIKKIIVKGGANLGKSPAMPSHTLLRDRPEVLDGLVKIIRGFAKHR
jgi:mono/diheme cytochrome c family protein